MRRRSLAVAACVLASPLGAAAQQAIAPAHSEKIEVTGTNIRRADSETGLPVQVITRDDMERAGIQTAQDLVDRISAHQSAAGHNDAKGIGSASGSFSAASLRGLGSDKTLVLLNGRRLAPYALSLGTTIDISSIPMGAIERVEVLKDGASAVYGTDAIGGVINFILRKDFTGVEVAGTILATQQGGGGSRRATGRSATATCSATGSTRS
jgi:iron complex outermembrane receptor protein